MTALTEHEILFLLHLDDLYLMYLQLQDIQNNYVLAINKRALVNKVVMTYEEYEEIIIQLGIDRSSTSELLSEEEKKFNSKCYDLLKFYNKIKI